MPAFANARPHMPQVFKDILINDARREALRDGSAAGVMTQTDWRELRELVSDRQSLRRGAELALRWNTDKGAAIS